MAHLTSCFATPIAVNFSPTRQNHCKNVITRSVLEEVRDPAVKTIPPPQECPAHQHKSQRAKLPPGVSPANFRVYPNGFPDEKNDLPSPNIHYTLPIFGYVLEYLGLGITPRDRARKFGDIYTSSGFFRRMHYISDWTATQEMIKDSKTLLSKDSSQPIIDLFGVNSMLNKDADDHKSMRDKFAPAFSPRLFSFYSERIRSRAETEWKKISEETLKDGIQVPLSLRIRDLYLAITIEMVNGLGLKREEYSRVRELYTIFLNAVIMPSFTPGYKKAMKAREELLKIISNVIERMLIDDADIIEELRKYGDKIPTEGGKDILKGRVCIAQIWAAASPEVNVGKNAKNDPEVLYEQALISLGFWFAGMATSAATTSSALLEMGFSDDIWSRLTEEQDSIVRENNGARTVLYEQTKQMKLLDSFLEEILRIHPTSVGVLRRAGQDFEVFGRKVEKDDLVFFDIHAACHDERYYKDPEKVIMDRFLKTGDGPIPPTSMTFGPRTSPHFCLGASLSKVLMKTTLAILLREYTMQVDESQSRKFKPLPDNVPESNVIINTLKPRF